MLRSLKDLERCTVGATDGDIGAVVDFLLDDRRWTIRHLVVRAGGFFGGREVLLSPSSFGRVDWADRRFQVALRQERVRGSPAVDTAVPVSRQSEIDLARYYEYPGYWNDPDDATAAPPSPKQDAHLRSARAIRGYHVEGTDGAIGHLADFVVDDSNWEIRYLAVETSNWWIGQTVLVAPQWASRVSWEERKLFFELTRDAIKRSPLWNPQLVIERAYEAQLHAHYAKPAYWGAPVPPAPPQQHRGGWQPLL